MLIVFVGLMILGYYGWRRFHRTTSSLTMRLLETETEVEKYRKVWHIPADEVEMSVCIGSGAVGEVFKGKWRGIDVAIKTVKGAWMSSEEMERELDHEASMLQAVRHANVVQFYGMGTLGDGTPFMVTELMELGTLSGVLQDVGGVELNWETKYRFVLETAQGMALVHSLGRMHRDLKSANILVTMSGLGGLMRLKVSDFGTATLASIAAGGGGAAQTSLPHQDVTMSTYTDRARTVRTKGIGTPLWMAPEVLEGNSRYGPSADVYSYGIVMWEIASRDEPWSDVQGSFLMDALLERIKAGIRPPIDVTWPHSYVAMMQECWRTEAEARPSFAEIVKSWKVDKGR